MYGLIIKKKWLDLIMSGQKTLEIRGNRTSHVGEEIALLESGSQKIRGFCTIKEVTVLDKEKWEAHREHHCVDVPWENLIKRYKTPYAWHLSAITPKEGLTYKHPKGAVIWVNLDHVFYKDGDKIYINGSPAEDGFDLNGVNLDKYDIKIKNDTVYLMSK